MSRRSDDQDDFGDSEPVRREPRRRGKKSNSTVLIAVVVGGLSAVIAMVVFGIGFFSPPDLQQAYFDAAHNRAQIEEGKTYSGRCTVIEVTGKDAPFQVLGTWPNSDQQGPALVWEGSFADAPKVGRSISFKCKIVKGKPVITSWN